MDMPSRNWHSADGSKSSGRAPGELAINSDGQIGVGFNMHGIGRMELTSQQAQTYVWKVFQVGLMRSIKASWSERIRDVSHKADPSMGSGAG